MSRQTTKNEILKYDLLVEFFHEHKGAENFVTANEVADFLAKNGFPIKQRSVNSLITNLKKQRYIPICYIRRKGYFWARTKAEILSTINDMQMMINSLQEHIDLLREFIID